MALDITFDRILHNLGMVAGCGVNTTLRVEGGLLMFENRVIPSLQRQWTNDGRKILTEAIRDTLRECYGCLHQYSLCRYCTTLERLDNEEERRLAEAMVRNTRNVHRMINNVRTGLNNLRQFCRYQASEEFQQNIDRIMELTEQVESMSERVLDKMAPE